MVVGLLLIVGGVVCVDLGSHPRPASVIEAER
jgi:hypothetical protein